MDKHFFNEYGYQTQQKFIGKDTQLKNAGYDRDFCKIIGRGFGDCEFPQPNKPKILTFTAVKPDTSIKLAVYMAEGQAVYPSIEYSIDKGKTWNNYTITNQEDENIIQMTSVGDSVQFRGVNSTFNTNEMILYFVSFGEDASISASGDVTSLINGIGGDAVLPERCFLNLFAYFTQLTTAPALPATTLAPTCYQSMFGGCTSLTTAPALPATTLAQSCYSYMFGGCTSLTTAPALQAATLAERCYEGMFDSCTGLTTAPELPATTLGAYCYSYMFSGCTSLTTAPELPATTLAEGCYQYMFRDCTNLSSIACLATDISATDCTNSWVSGITQNGTFTKAASMNSWKTGDNGIPSGWTVEDYTNATTKSDSTQGNDSGNGGSTNDNGGVQGKTDETGKVKEGKN